MSEHVDAVIRWCDCEGASFLEEVADHAVELAEALDLSAEERDRLVSMAWSALHAVGQKRSGAVGLGANSRHGSHWSQVSPASSAGASAETAPDLLGPARHNSCSSAASPGSDGHDRQGA